MVMIVKTPAKAPQEVKEEPVVVEEIPMSEEDKAQKTAHETALKEKEAGNVAYKKKNFAKAIEHYTKALELFDEDITFLTNRAG